MPFVISVKARGAKEPRYELDLTRIYPTSEEAWENKHGPDELVELITEELADARYPGWRLARGIKKFFMVCSCNFSTTSDDETEIERQLLIHRQRGHVALRNPG